MQNRKNMGRKKVWTDYPSVFQRALDHFADGSTRDWTFDCGTRANAFAMQQTFYRFFSAVRAAKDEVGFAAANDLGLNVAAHFANCLIVSQAQVGDSWIVRVRVPPYADAPPTRLTAETKQLIEQSRHAHEQRRAAEETTLYQEMFGKPKDKA